MFTTTLGSTSALSPLTIMVLVAARAIYSAWKKEQKDSPTIYTEHELEAMRQDPTARERFK